MSSVYYLRQQYRLSRAEALDQVAFMNARNEESAEKAGGVDQLEGAAKARYHGIKQRLITLAAADSVAAEYVEALEAEIGDALRRASKAEHDLRELRGEILEPMPKIGYRDWLGSMVFGLNVPHRLGALLDHREALREATRLELATHSPQFF